jgi:site-specific DNA-methyltransferase (adenine-specific)
MDGLPIFVNPPYSRLKTTKKHGVGWVEKCRKEAARGRRVVALIPARTDTSWYHEHILPHAKVFFLRGRVRFGTKGTPAPFPSCVAVWDKPSNTREMGGAAARRRGGGDVAARR